MNLKSRKIGVLMGGFSSEREISLRSGKNVLNVLQSGGYNAVGIDVSDDLIDILRKEKVEMAFNVLHGRFGEDGRVQSILDFLHIPFTGSSVEASSVAINKILTKQLCGLFGVNTAKFRPVSSYDDCHSISFPLPWIIKPVDEGSSINIQIIKKKEELKEFDFNKRNFFIEQFIKGKEVTVGILDNGKTQLVLPILELIPKNAFYDFEAKYTKGMTTFVLPAAVSDEMRLKLEKAALTVHKTLKCCGATRSDFIIQGEEIYFLEINTNPGMTETSDIPAQARCFGMNDLELCEKILESALK